MTKKRITMWSCCQTKNLSRHKKNCPIIKDSIEMAEIKKIMDKENK